MDLVRKRVQLGERERVSIFKRGNTAPLDRQGDAVDGERGAGGRGHRRGWGECWGGVDHRDVWVTAPYRRSSTTPTDPTDASNTEKPSCSRESRNSFNFSGGIPGRGRETESTQRHIIGKRAAQWAHKPDGSNYYFLGASKSVKEFQLHLQG